MIQMPSNEVPENETAILDALVAIRAKLAELKHNRARYLESKDVLAIYEELIPQIRQINEIRSAPALKHERNRLDVVLDDVFQLLSLAFLTVGLNREVPALYASISTVHRLLDHLKESLIYTDKDTISIRERLDEIKGIIESANDTESPDIIRLIKVKLTVCEVTLDEVENSMKSIFNGLQPILRELVAIKREILAIGSKPKYTPQLFDPIKDKLALLESQRVDNNWVSEDGSVAQEGQGLLNGLLEECHTMLKDFAASADATNSFIPEPLKPTYNELTSMKGRLEGLLITHRWTLRETDLYSYQKNLKTIDEFVKGKAFQDLVRGHPRAQPIILYLLRRNFAILYKLLESSEPVSEALIPINNQLDTVRRCLLEVQRMGGLSSARELFPYQMKLASIDNLRVDGKFMVGEAIPEGQGMLNALLSECFDICHELQSEFEDPARETKESSQESE